MFVGLGLGFAWKAGSYEMGAAARTGPGYFPFWLGIALALLGATVLLRSLSTKADETHVEKLDARIVFLVIGSVVLYGVLLEVLGIYLSVFMLVVLSSLASHQFSPRVAVTSGVLLALFSYLTFVKGLGLTFPLWPSFLGVT